MHYQSSASPQYQHRDQWYQWHQSPNQYQRPSFSDPNTFNGNPEQNLHPHWNQHQASYDYGTTWAARTPLTASASSPTSLSRTTSWPVFPPPSTWTSPLTSPECGLPPFATSTPSTTTPFLIGVTTPASTAQTTAMSPSVSYESHMNPFDPSHHQHHTPVAYQQMTLNEVCPVRTSFSCASSPTMFSHHTSHPLGDTELSGLGIGPVQDLAYPVYIKEEEQREAPSPPATPTDTASARRLIKRRKRKESSSSFRRYRPFHCSYCAFSFDRKCNLTCHLKTHGVGRGRVTCPEEGCGKEYGRQADVNRHVRTVHRGASFTCDDCGKNFGRNDILMRHEEACAKRKERLGLLVGQEEEEELEGYY